MLSRKRAGAAERPGLENLGFARTRGFESLRFRPLTLKAKDEEKDMAMHDFSVWLHSFRDFQKDPEGRSGKSRGEFYLHTCADRKATSEGMEWLLHWEEFCQRNPQLLTSIFDLMDQFDLEMRPYFSLVFKSGDRSEPFHQAPFDAREVQDDTNIDAVRWRTLMQEQHQNLIMQEFALLIQVIHEMKDLGMNVDQVDDNELKYWQEKLKLIVSV